MTAANSHISCTSGNGAMLDFAVASQDMCDRLTDVELKVMPWKTHLAFVFNVKGGILNLGFTTYDKINIFNF